MEVKTFAILATANFIGMMILAFIGEVALTISASTVLIMITIIFFGKGDKE